MYISAFRIDRFGIFSNVDVAGLRPGFNIFFGPNESGKSTCAEFLRTMLAGLPSSGYSDFPYVMDSGPMAGSLTLQAASEKIFMGEIELTRPSGDNISLMSASRQPLPENLLRDLMGNISGDIYRTIFSFGLRELETFQSLASEDVKKTLYNASFGNFHRRPSEALNSLEQRLCQLYEEGNPERPLNAALLRLSEIRARISALLDRTPDYDDLCAQLKKIENLVSDLRQRKTCLNQEQYQLTRRLNAWSQWNEWRAQKNLLEKMAKPATDFPEDARQRLEQIQQAIDGNEEKVATGKEKVSRLNDLIASFVIDFDLVENLPALRGLAERKSSYRQALIRLPALKETLERAGEDLEYGLCQLGAGWDCDRIRATDRSLFAREDMEKQAREMNAAMLARQAAIDYLANSNKDVEKCEAAISDARQALENIPHAEAALNDRERDELRQNMARLEESRRMEPVRESAVQNAKNAFIRSLKQVNIPLPDENREDFAASARKIIDDILTRQNEALEMAETLQARLAEAAECSQQEILAQENVDAIKKKMEDMVTAQRTAQGPARDTLDTRSRALRSLRVVSATIDSEKERLKELDNRIGNEKEPARVKNWILISAAILFILAAAAIFIAHWGLGLTHIVFGEMDMPVNLWSAYGALVCGVAMLAGGMPGHGPEIKRHKQEMAQLRSRREACAMRLNELEAQARQLCSGAGVENADPIALDATEILLEREKEQCFHAEQNRRDMENLKTELAAARAVLEKAHGSVQQKENEVQQCRHKWHNLMQDMKMSFVPSPESAPTFFARVEAARLAFDNVFNSQKELDSLWNDLRQLEEGIAQMPAIAQKIKESENALNIEDAVNQLLDSCREADLLREKRIASQAALESHEADLNRAVKRQEEATQQLEACASRLETASQNWSALLSGFGFDGSLDPETVRNAFKFMENCLLVEEKLARAKRDMAQCNADLEALRAPLGDLLARMGRGAKTDPDSKTDWLATLDNLLTDAENSFSSQKEKERFAKQLHDEEIALAADQAALDAAFKRREDLLGQAGADSANDFLRLARERDEFIALQNKLAASENSLAIAAGNQRLEEFLESFKTDDQNAMLARNGEIQDEIENISRQEIANLSEIEVLRKKIGALDKSDELASLHQEEEIALADIKHLGIAWNNLALAKGLLEKAMAIWEREKQPDSLRAASRVFSGITGGLWSGVNVSMENGQINLLNAKGKALPAKALSNGTREQAYLSMRLAYVAGHADKFGPIPLIMDEALGNFDLDRVQKTIQSLASLPSAQQIIYFTCHQYMVDMIKSVSPGSPVYMARAGKIAAA